MQYTTFFLIVKKKQDPADFILYFEVFFPILQAIFNCNRQTEGAG